MVKNRFKKLTVASFWGGLIVLVALGLNDLAAKRADGFGGIDIEQWLHRESHRDINIFRWIFLGHWLEIEWDRCLFKCKTRDVTHSRSLKKLLGAFETWMVSWFPLGWDGLVFRLSWLDRLEHSEMWCPPLKLRCQVMRMEFCNFPGKTANAKSNWFNHCHIRFVLKPGTAASFCKWQAQKWWFSIIWIFGLIMEWLVYTFL